MSILHNKDILRTDVLTDQELDLILRVAARFEEMWSSEGQLVNLRGQMLATLFFEPSTRTRASFELAAKRLGGDVLNLDVSTSSRAKGESLLDTIYTLQAMQCDIFVVRDAQAGVGERPCRTQGCLGLRHEPGATLAAACYGEQVGALLQLELLLQRSGLERGVHYDAQTALTSADGSGYFSYTAPCELLTCAGDWTVRASWNGDESHLGATSALGDQQQGDQRDDGEILQQQYRKSGSAVLGRQLLLLREHLQDKSGRRQCEYQPHDDRRVHGQPERHRDRSDRRRGSRPAPSG